MQDKTIDILRKEESERMQKYLKEISKTYGIRLAEIGEFLGKKLRDNAKGAHQWFMAFMVIDEIFDEMEGKFAFFAEDTGQRETFKSLIQEAKERIKEELPLPKIEGEK